MTQNFKDKLYLLAIGAGVTFFASIATLWSSQYVLKADYDRDRVSNTQVIAKVEASLGHIDESLREIRKELRDIRSDMRRD